MILGDFGSRNALDARYQQVAFADLILLNKMDLVPKELLLVRDRLRSINPYAKMRVDLEELRLNAHSLEEFDKENLGQAAPDQFPRERTSSECWEILKNTSWESVA